MGEGAITYTELYWNTKCSAKILCKLGGGYGYGTILFDKMIQLANTNPCGKYPEFIFEGPYCIGYNTPRYYNRIIRREEELEQLKRNNPNVIDSVKLGTHLLNAYKNII